MLKFGRTSCCEGDKIDVVFVVEKLLKSDVGSEGDK